MNRSNYTDDIDDPWRLIRWRGQVASSIRGKRGQAFLRELLAALDAMPEKRLIREALEDDEGEVCALGCLGRQRGIDMTKIDPEDYESIAAVFGVAEPLIRELEHENDAPWDWSPETRWRKVRQWVAEQITDATEATEKRKP